MSESCENLLILHPALMFKWDLSQSIQKICVKCAGTLQNIIVYFVVCQHTTKMNRFLQQQKGQENQNCYKSSQYKSEKQET